MKSLRGITGLTKIGELVKRRAGEGGGAALPIAVRTITGLPLAKIRRVRRLTFFAKLDARRTVRACTPELAYLRSRHAIYRSTAPRDVSAPIPETDLDASTGDFIVLPADQRHPSDTIFDSSLEIASMQGPVAAEAAFQRNASHAAGEAIAQRLEEHESDRRTVERQLREADEQLDAIQSEQHTSAAAQRKAAQDGSIDVTPPIAAPSAMRIALWRLFEIMTIASEAIVCVAAFLNTSGIDPANLSTEWAHGAAPQILLWTVAALITSALLFVMTEWAFARIGAGIDDASDPARAFRMTTGVATLVFVAAVVAAIAYLRAQLGATGVASLSTGIYFLIGAVPLVGGALVHLHANTLSVARAEALRAAVTPDSADVARRLRSEHEEALIAHRDRLRARREQLTAAIQLLNRQMHAAEQAVRDIARHETRVVQEWLDSVRAALAKDQRYFGEYARTWSNRSHLLIVAPSLAPAGTLVPMRKRRMP